MQGQCTIDTEKVIGEAVTEGIYLFLVSEKSLRSQWCLSELKFAYSFPSSEKKLIVPIMLGSEFQTDPSVIPHEINEFCWFFLSENPSDSELDELLKHLNEITKDNS